MLQSLKKGWLSLIAAFAGLAVAGCATAAPETREGPALWRVADEDTSIYLFGTIHTLPEGVAWRTPRIEQAIAASDELVTEIALGADETPSATAMMRLGIARDLPPILERVPAERREALRQAIAGTGIPIAVYDRMKTWTAALTIAAFAFRQAGLDPEQGVDRRLSAAFSERRRRLSGLETLEEQLGFFDNLSEEEERAFLQGVLETPAEIRGEFDQMLAAWLSGDTAAIARTFDDETTISPQLREALMTRRNERWAAWLRRRLEQPGTVFVAVGAGHLAGRDSVQAMLERAGLSVERVQ